MAYSSIWSDLNQTSFEQGFVDAGGIRTRYLHSGRRGDPAVIFLHGTGGHAEAYCRNLASHGAQFDTYSIDMLGHGYTDKPEYDYELERYHAHLAAFLDAVGLKQASFSGESLGGWVAASFAVRNPKRVDKLVLNTAAADKIDPKALEALRVSTIAAVQDPNPDKIRARLQWLMRRPEQVTDDLVACRQAIYAQDSMKAAVHRLLCLHTMEARRKYALSDGDWASLRCPTMVLWTSHDPTASVEVGRELAGKIKGARFEVMQECGHWPQFEDAPTFNDLHIDFLRSA